MFLSSVVRSRPAASSTGKQLMQGNTSAAGFVLNLYVKSHPRRSIVFQSRSLERACDFKMIVVFSDRSFPPQLSGIANS